MDANPDNYLNGKLKADCKLEPTPVPIYKGMKIFLTKNIRKQDDYVNGMSATVEQYYEDENTLRVAIAS